MSLAHRGAFGSRLLPDASGILHGYYRDAAGTLHFPIDPSGTGTTILFGDNNRNWVVGRYIDRYLGRPVLSRMYCTSCSSLVLTSRAVTNLVFSMPALSTRFGIDACGPAPSP